MYNLTLFLLACLFYMLVATAFAAIVFLFMSRTSSTNRGLIAGSLTPFLLVFTWLLLISIEEGVPDATSVIPIVFVYGFLGLVVTCPTAVITVRALDRRRMQALGDDEDTLK